MPVRSEPFLEQAYEFAKNLLRFPDTHGEVLRYYRAEFFRHPDLFTCAMANERLCGCVLASIENARVLVGPVAVAPPYRDTDVIRAMMSRTERVTEQLGYDTLILGSVPDAHTLYVRAGFEPYLLVQAPYPHRLDALLMFSPGAAVVWSTEEDGWVQVLLKTDRIETQLARRYEQQFTGCQAHEVFMKRL